MSKLVKILSIDGGGIRGLIPALILAEIEKRTGKAIAELFDLVAGSSTGGILALGLATPDKDKKPAYKAEEIAHLYELKGCVAFPEALHQFSFLIKKLQKFGILPEKYPAKFINRLFEDLYKDSRLSDAITEVFITTYEIEKRTPVFLTSRKARENNAYDFLMKEAAYAGAAAPTYFDPIKLNLPDKSDSLALLDGGIYANNPALCALAEARKTYPQNTDFLVVSLGTGSPALAFSCNKAKRWKRADWARKIMDIAADGTSVVVDEQLKCLLPDINNQKRYYRLQVQLNPDNEAIDNVNPQNLGELRALAEQFIYENDADLNNLCKILTI